jgi:hypothetical protein
MVLSFLKGALFLNFNWMIVHEIMITGVQQFNTFITIHTGLHAWVNMLDLGT